MPVLLPQSLTTLQPRAGSENRCAGAIEVKLPALRGHGLFWFLSITAFLSVAIVLVFATTVEQWTALSVVVIVLTLLNALWISGGAATATLGLLCDKKNTMVPTRLWQPSGRTAILVTLCGEDPVPLANYLAEFTKSLHPTSMQHHTAVFVISDTAGEHPIAKETNTLATLVAEGKIKYRRRHTNIRKKPGNIADWLHHHGSQFDYMIVKDADSRMTPDSVKQLIWRLEQSPNTGLLQAAIALIPGRTRFGRHLRTSSRLLAPNFAYGFAAWSGKAGNFWGHNAIMRIEAFKTASVLPRLPGKAPLGGDLLSHDFIEAAWMRRAGWDIQLAPDIRGSAEDAPQTTHDFFRRDRRWCQGNLQHTRLLTQPNLHALSRLHLVTGIFSYLSAPIWFLLLLLLSFGLVSVTNLSALVLVAVVLFIPKACALIERFQRVKTAYRRRVVLRAWFFEIGLSTLLGPLISLHNTISIGAILTGRDCGWKASHRTDWPRPWRLPDGCLEAGVGGFALVMALSHGSLIAAWLAPIILPLLLAPLLIPFLNAEPVNAVLFNKERLNIERLKKAPLNDEPLNKEPLTEIPFNEEPG